MQHEGILEVHYHLMGDSHSMDASIKNRCEHEVIAIFNQINKDFGLNLELESLVDQEGGIRQFWKIFEDPANAQHTIPGFFAVLVAIIGVIGGILNSPDKPDAEIEKLNKQLLELKVMQEGINTQKALDGLLEKKQSLDAPRQSEKAPFVNTRFTSSRSYEKITSHRSNFYKLLQPYEKVVGVGFSWGAGMDSLSQERYVPKANFPTFILAVEKLKPQVIPTATIEIVAPVITDGNIQWKGIFNGESITFSMKDKNFKEDVVNRQVVFKSGDAIECELEIEHKYNEAGDRVFGSYKVVHVYGKVEIQKGQPDIELADGKISNLRKAIMKYHQSKYQDQEQKNPNLNLDFGDA